MHCWQTWTGGWIVLHKCLVHVEVMLWMAMAESLLSMWCCLSCVQILWSLVAVLSWYDMLKCRLYCELLLMLNMSPMFCFLCRRLWSEQCWVCCYSIVMHSFSGWRGQCAFCGVHSWQNGTRWSRDGVKYCGSFQSSLVSFWGFRPTCTCFQSENFFVTCFCSFFLRNGKKREVGGEAMGKMHGL